MNYQKIDNVIIALGNVSYVDGVVVGKVLINEFRINIPISDNTFLED